MPREIRTWVVLLLLMGLLGAGRPATAEDDALGFERTPPRLAYLEGEVSFYRPGAPDWVPAAVNTPLSAGDELYAPAGSNLEVQIGPSAFLRAGEDAEIALASLEPDYLQLRVTAGTLSLDLRGLEPGQTFEVDTPNAAFTIERGGYYRVDVYDDVTTFITRRGGRASVALARGTLAALAASEQVVITGIESPQIESYAAPDLDDWDRWNYARTDGQLEAVSARYVPAGVYGVQDLDQYGSWRVVPTYGAIWVPRRTAVGWAPYTTGRWVYDFYYGWTWVDTAPWGWAPYHYGRWVYVSGYWGWAPGPTVARAYYAPALVGFYGGVGGPIGWVALGWGEPLFPWWGPSHFRHRAHWAGWGGPRVVNKVVIKQKTVINVKDVHTYANTRVPHAFVAMDRESFGRRSVKKGRLASANAANFEPLNGDLELRPARESLSPSTVAGRRPPSERRERSVVATRAPSRRVVPDLEPSPSGDRAARRGDAPGRDAAPAETESRVRVVAPPRAGTRPESLDRPPFGKRAGKERAAPPPPPRYRSAPPPDAQKARAPSERAPEAPKPGPAPRAARTERPAPSSSAVGPEAAPGAAPAPRTERSAGEAARKGSASPRSTREAAPKLPGVPANRVYRGRGEPSRPPAAEPAPDPGTRGDAGRAGEAPGAGGGR